MTSVELGRCMPGAASASSSNRRPSASGSTRARYPRIAPEHSSSRWVLTLLLTCTVLYLALGLAARTVLRTRPSAARAAGRVAGAVMIVVGTGLLLERLR